MTIDNWDIHRVVDEVVALRETVAGQESDIKELRQQVQELRTPMPIPNMEEITIDLSKIPNLPSGGGSRMDKPLFGYEDSGSHYSSCRNCGEPASEHACPEVKP